jgi:hypothetical protein
MIDIEELKTVLSYIAEDEEFESHVISLVVNDLLVDIKAFESKGSTDVKELEFILNNVEDFIQCELYENGEDTYCEMLEAAVETTRNSIEDNSEELTESENFNNSSISDSSDVDASKDYYKLEPEFKEWYDSIDLEDNPVEFNSKLAYKAGSRLAGYYKFDEDRYENTWIFFNENDFEPELYDLFYAGYQDHYNPNKRFPKINEDVEFGKDSTGKIQMRKISNGYKSTYATNKNAHGLTPDTKITTPGSEEKKVAKAVYDILKKKGKDKDVSQKFNISPRPDLVMKGNDDVLVTPDNGKDPYTITNDEIEAELAENTKSRRARYNYHRF